MNVTIIDYNAGNTQSVLFALERVGINAIVSNDPDTIHKSDKVIFPGVGEASSAMAYLKEKKLDKVITSLKQPVLGICLGMQLLCNYSEEGDTDCLGIFDVNVKKFEPLLGDQGSKIKVPHTGWNTINNLKSHLFKGIAENNYMYFVHSYYAACCDKTISITNYINPYSSAFVKDNFYGVQFHPEKSAEAGQKILENFIQLC
jgi:glutamine amidotransferase